MALFKTNLVLVAAPLPPDFEGDPGDFQRALIERLEILSPVGTNFFVVGDVEPPSNQGPWLKNGRAWYVFDEAEGGYVPADVTDSVQSLFTVSDDEPSAPTPEEATIWLRTLSGRVIGWYFWNGTFWRPGGNVPPSGPTSERPANPQNLEQFFDTTINVLIHWERGAWRTVSGTPGDVKFVTGSILSESLAANPGWSYLGEDNEAYRGRVIGVASKDAGATPVSSYSTASGVSARAAQDVAGVEEHVLSDDEIPQHTHLMGSLTQLNNDNNINLYRVDNGDQFSAPEPRPPNYARITGDAGENGTKNGQLPATANGTMLVTSKQLTKSIADAYTEVAEAHTNLQPTVWLWALKKD